MLFETFKYLNKEVLETESPIDIGNDVEKTCTKICSISYGLIGIKIKFVQIFIWHKIYKNIYFFSARPGP